MRNCKTWFHLTHVPWTTSLLSVSWFLNLLSLLPGNRFTLKIANSDVSNQLSALRGTRLLTDSREFCNRVTWRFLAMNEDSNRSIHLRSSSWTSDWILYLVNRYGYPVKWINFIKQCIMPNLFWNVNRMFKRPKACSLKICPNGKRGALGNLNYAWYRMR